MSLVPLETRPMDCAHQLSLEKSDLIIWPQSHLKCYEKNNAVVFHKVVMKFSSVSNVCKYVSFIDAAKELSLNADSELHIML